MNQIWALSDLTSRRGRMPSRKTAEPQLVYSVEEFGILLPRSQCRRWNGVRHRFAKKICIA